MTLYHTEYSYVLVNTKFLTVTYFIRIFRVTNNFKVTKMADVPLSDVISPPSVLLLRNNDYFLK